jgi:hypothetical protein
MVGVLAELPVGEEPLEAFDLVGLRTVENED